MDQEIRTYVFLDLETTGLPSTNYGETKITELCILSVLKEHMNIVGEPPFKMPRVQNKIQMCFHPEKFIPEGAELVTGLNNELLEPLKPFDVNFCDMLTSFIMRCPQPVCLLAHNGNRFDFPLIQAQTKILGKPLPPEVLCADTLYAFRELKVTEKAPPWEIPRMVTTPFTPPPENRIDLTGDGSDSGIHWPLKDDFDDLTSADILKVMADIEKSVLDQDEQICRSSSYGSTPLKSQQKRSGEPRPIVLTKNLKRIPQANKETVKKQLFPPTREPRPVYNLKAVYEHLFKQDIPRIHSAEGDVQALLKITNALGAPFHEWVKKNNKRLNTILKMW